MPTTTAPDRADSDVPAFLAGGGAATALILARDWSDHPLGPPDAWPETLKTALSLILNSPESMILCWGREPLHFFFNETYFPLLGPRLDWAMGERFDRVWADGLDQAMPIVEAAFAGRSERFVDLPWKLDTDRGAADTWWTFSYSRVLDGAGEIAGLFIFTNETTERVLTDAALKRSQHELHALNEELEQRVAERTAERDRLWNISPDLMVVMNPDGTYRHVNPAWTRILGWSADDLIGIAADTLAHPDDLAATTEALNTTQTGMLDTFENRFRCKDGSYRWISWTAATGATELFATGRDVTAARERDIALREAEEQLRHAQKVEAVGQLTGGVAHDFNNFLTVIRGSVDLLRRPDLSDERRARYVDAIADTADRAARLTSQLLSFARRQTLTAEVFDLNDSVAAIADMVRTLVGARVQLELHLPAEPHFVSADRNQFETAMVNMAVNARDAMEGEGTITISVEAEPGVPQTRGHGAVAGDFATVSVADTGTGVDPAMADRIFEPFYTTKDVGHGTGLGLSQVFGFAKQSGGEVTVRPAHGGGACFTLYLPRVEDAPTGEALPSLPVSAQPALPIRVLVVEDNIDVGRFAEHALAELGYAVTLVTNAARALALLDGGAPRFDVVFSDVVMPGMSGVDLAQRLATLAPDLPVVLASGYSHVLAGNADHGFRILRKPYSVDELSATLNAAVGR